MKRFMTFSAGLLSAVAFSSLVLAAGHGGGGGGHGGGGGGHMGGGGGGMHMSGGGGGGFHGGSVHMGGFSAGPAFHSGSMGASGFRAPSNLGMRVAPSVSNFRAPSVNLGSSMSRSITSGVPRSAITNIHPNLGGSPGIKIQSGANLAGRTGGNNLGIATTNLRATSGGNGSLHMPFVGRVSPNQVGNFLSLSHGPAGLNSGAAFHGNQGINISHVAGHSNWHNLQTTQISHINNNVNGAFRNTNFNSNHLNNGFGFGFNNNSHWNNWAGGVRNNCNFNRFNNVFSNRFWATNYCYFPYRRSYYWWGAQPWSYWWGYPTWGGLCSWFGGGYGWNSPYYYGYGPGGNVVYNNGYVYMNGQQIATAEDYAASAAALADVQQPANPNQATDWLPLGTFTLSEGENDKNPSRVVQLAVDKEGNISGTMVNQTTNQTYPIQGRVDKDTQRVAFTIGGNKDVVLETGIFNLTQQQTPVLAHGEGREETYLMLRLDPPKSDDANAAPTPGANKLVP